MDVVTLEHETISFVLISMGLQYQGHFVHRVVP